LARWFAFMRMAVRGRGGDVDAATHIHQWVCEHGDFEDIVYKEYWVPTSPFLVGNDEASDWWRSVGEVIRQDAYVGLFTSYNCLWYDVLSGLHAWSEATPSWKRLKRGIRRRTRVSCKT
jgi:hypothetical protein